MLIVLFIFGDMCSGLVVLFFALLVVWYCLGFSRYSKFVLLFGLFYTSLCCARGVFSSKAVHQG